MCSKIWYDRESEKTLNVNATWPYYSTDSKALLLYGLRLVWKAVQREVAVSAATRLGFPARVVVVVACKSRRPRLAVSQSQADRSAPSPSR